MSDIAGKIVKPTAEFLGDIARKLPEAFGKGHHRIGTAVHKAADEFDKAEDDLTAKAGHHPHDFSDGHHDPADVAGTGAAAAAGARGGQNAVDDADRRAARTAGEPDPDNLRPGDDGHAALPGGEKHCETDPVDVATGDMLMPAVDVALPGALPLLLERTHISSYRHGRLFGASWSSTLDQRLQLDADGVVFASADGMRLEYPPPRAGGPVLPLKGPRLPLLWSGAPNDPMTVLDPRSGRALVFHDPRPAPGVPGAVTLRLTAMEDRNGRRIDIAWSARDLPELVTHHGGYRVAADPHPDLPRVAAFRLLDTDGPGTSTTLARYGYDSAGDLTEIYNSSGVPLRLTYDAEHRITSWTDRVGTKYHYAYDTAGRVVRTTGSGGFLSSTFAYDDETRTTRFTDSLGHTTVHRHNDAYRLVRSTDPLGNVTAQEWSDDNRLLKSFTDALGRVTRYEHDALDNVTAVVHPDGSRVSFAYDRRGKPVTMTDRAGNGWHTEYDDRGNRVATVDALGARTEYTYGDTGDLVAVTNALGARQHLTTNAAGLPTAVTDPLGRTTTARRDAFGRVVESTDPLGNTVRVGWTTESRVTWCERADGRRESWEFDAEGNPVSHTGPDGRVSTLGGTHFELVAESVTAAGTAHTFGYDTEKRLTSVTNALGLTWRYTYDPAGRLVRETDFDGRTLTYAYDAAGQLAARTNGAGETVTFTRDTLGRITAFGHGDEATAFTYDTAGNLRRSVNADAEVVREHDAVGRVVAETVNGRTISYSYDLLGRRTERRTPSGTVSTWTYDAAGLPEALVVAGHRTSFTFDPLGRETARAMGAGFTQTQEWDVTGRPVRQGVARGAADGTAPILERRYGFGPDDLVTEIRDLTAGTRRLALDPSGRVASVTAAGWTEAYAYDALGNVTRASTPLTAPGETEREYSGTRLRRAGRTTYEYDAQGRTVRTVKRLLNGQTRVRAYTWNTYDQLVAARTPDGERWRYRYDAAGRRIAKERLAADGGVAEEIHFTWAATGLAEQATHSGTTTWEHVPGGHRPLAQVDRRPGQPEIDARFHAIVTDLVGAPTELVTPEGEIAWRQRTTLWGLPVSGPPGGAVDCPLRFPGQYSDPETGWHHNYFRHYDPETGRYVTPDPLGLTPAPNPVAYVHNPTALIDPLGLAFKPNLAGWNDEEPIDPTWGGQVVYSPLDGHGRPTGVTAEITAKMLGQSTDPQIAFSKMPGWEDGQKFNRTHLLAASLGGSNNMPENFVTAHRFANHPIMYHYEKAAADGVARHGAIDYKVTPVYRYEGQGPMRPEDLRPIGMTVEATSPDGKFTFTPYPQRDQADRQILHYDEDGNLNKVTILNVPKCQLP